MNTNYDTFLTIEQYFGNEISKELKKYGTKAAITDFAILSGGDVSDSCHTTNRNNLEDRTGYYWTKSPGNAYEDGRIRIVDHSGGNYSEYPNNRRVAARPASPYSDQSLISPNVERGLFRQFKKTETEVEHGEYPQQAFDKNLQATLENEYQAGRLKVASRRYTIDSRKARDLVSEFEPQQLQEIEYNGKRLVRVIANLRNDPTTLSNGMEVRTGDAVWVEIQPVTKINLKKNKLLLCKSLMYPLQFNIERIDDYDAISIKIFNELRFGVECTKDQLAPKEYVLGEKYKKVPANAFNGINGLERIILQSQTQEIGTGAFKGFGFISMGQDGKLVVSKTKIQNALWELNLDDREPFYIANDNSSKLTIYVKNKYGNVDLITEFGEKNNICNINTFNKLKKQNFIGALDGWLTLRDEYKSESPLYMEVLLATNSDTNLYKKFFESKTSGFDQLIKRQWYSALSDESKEDLMKLFISLGGFEMKGQKDVLTAIDKLQEAYQDRFNSELHHLFMGVPKGDKHIFGLRDGKEGIFSFSRTILNFLKKYEGQYRTDEFKKTITSMVSYCPKIYQAYRKHLRNLNPNYTEATNPDATLYEKTKNEGLSTSFILQWLSSKKYVYLDNEKLKQRLMHLPQGVTIAKDIALKYEQLLDRDIPEIIESVKGGKRKRNKYFVNLIDDSKEVHDDNSSGIHYEWAEINRTNALTCGEYMQTCFKPGLQNRFAFYNCIDNPEDAFMLLYDSDLLAGYCRVRYYPDRQGILVDNVELSHYAGDIFSNAQRREFAARCKKGLLDMAQAMNQIGYPVKRIYSKQDNWADSVILDEWKKQHHTVDKLKNVSAMQEVTYSSPRELGNYSASNIGEQIVIMEEEQRGMKR